VGNGFSFNSAVVYDTGFDSLNGNYVRLTADGALWNYLHLETILVTKGQVLEGEDMVDESMARSLLTLSTLMAQPGVAPDRQPTQQEIKNLVGRTVEDACNSLTSTAPWGQNWNYVKHYVEDVATASQNALNKQNVEVYINNNLS
jgi:hypothetical protein